VDDPGQLRTGTDFEARCLRCVEELGPIVGEMAARLIEEVPFEDQNRAFEPLALMPPRCRSCEPSDAGVGFPLREVAGAGRIPLRPARPPVIATMSG
jgi:hypothetical protein